MNVCILKIITLFVLFTLLIVMPLIFQVFISIVQPNDLCTLYQTIVFLKLQFRSYLLFNIAWISSKLIFLCYLPIIHLQDKQECLIFELWEEFQKGHWQILWGSIGYSSTLKLQFLEIKLKIKFYFFLHEFLQDLAHQRAHLKLSIGFLQRKVLSDFSDYWVLLNL